MTYKEQLKTKEWQLFRVRVFNHYRDCGCLGCGDYSNEGKHEVHHLRYINGRKAWQYEMKDVVPLCRGCHELYHQTKIRLENIITEHTVLFPMDFIKIVDLFEKELETFKTKTHGKF